jgi:hypothetical protein
MWYCLSQLVPISTDVVSSNPAHGRRGVFDTTSCETVCLWLAAGRWFSWGAQVSHHHDITEILLKVNWWHPLKIGDVVIKRKKHRYVLYVLRFTASQFDYPLVTSNFSYAWQKHQVSSFEVLRDYVVKQFVCDLRQVGGFRGVRRFPTIMI